MSTPFVCQGVVTLDWPFAVGIKIEYYYWYYNQIDHFAIIEYKRVLRRTTYPITDAQSTLGPFRMIENYLIRL